MFICDQYDESTYYILPTPLLLGYATKASTSFPWCALFFLFRVAGRDVVAKKFT